MKTCGIYGIVNTANNKVLVGSSNDIKRRWKDHKVMLKANRHYNPHFQFAWNHYGETSFEFRIIEICEEYNLISREDFWMVFYQSMDPNSGYNMQSANRTISPNKGKKLSIEQRQKISERQKGKHLSEEHRQKIRERMLINNPFLGKSHTEVTKEKMRQMKLGTRQSEITKTKRSNALKGNKNAFGYKHTEIQNKAKSLRQKGRILRPETIEKMRLSWRTRHPITSVENNAAKTA